jgi:hypothetical protein
LPDNFAHRLHRDPVTSHQALLNNFSTLLHQQYPRCLAHHHKSSCILLSASFPSAHYVQRCCHPAGFQKLKKGLLDNSAYGYTTSPTLRSRVALRRLPDGDCLDLTTFSLHILTLGRCISEILDISFVLETGWHMDRMVIWSGVWLREMVICRGICSPFLYFLLLSLHMISRLFGGLNSSGSSQKHTVCRFFSARQPENL